MIWIVYPIDNVIHLSYSVYHVFENNQKNGDMWIPLISNTTNDKATHETTKEGRRRVWTMPIYWCVFQLLQLEAWGLNMGGRLTMKQKKMNTMNLTSTTNDLWRDVNEVYMKMSNDD